MSQEPRAEDYIQEIGERLEADLFLFSAEISNENFESIFSQIKATDNKRENVALILSTNGGNPHAAYRISRLLKTVYEKFTLFVYGRCKSAGTLIAVAADEIVMTELAELGPLDMQVYKQDDFNRSSGLNVRQAIETVSEQAWSNFETTLYRTSVSSGGIISVKTGASIAIDMAVGLAAPLLNQIDPLMIGETARDTEIAFEYGIRLNPEKTSSIRKLVQEYPSHGFVIYKDEVNQLFDNVRAPTSTEEALGDCFFDFVKAESQQSIVIHLNSKNDDIGEGTDTENTDAIEAPSELDVDNNKEIENEHQESARKPAEKHGSQGKISTKDRSTAKKKENKI